MKKRIIAITFALFILLSLVSCGADGAYTESYKSNGLSYDMAYPTEEAEMYYSEDYDVKPYSYGSSSGNADYSRKDTPKNDVSNRKIIKTANLNFQTKEFDNFLASFKQTIAEYGGYIESSDIYGGGSMDYRYSRNANMTVRIPADSYEIFMETAATLGNLTRSNEYINDVTLAYVDIESRINAYETEYNALMELLAKAESVDAIIQLRNRISDIQYQLESYKSQIRKYDDLISYCTVNMYVEEVKVETVSVDKMSVGERIATGFKETIENIKVGFEDFAVWFVVNILYIIIYAVIVAVIVIVAVVIIKKIAKNCSKKAKHKADEEKESNK